VFVDLAEHIDVGAEIARKTKELVKLEAAISDKERKLANANFVERAPADVIGKERSALDALKDLHTATQVALVALQKARK
jgi:valyl-tRNA synthetase